MTKVVTLTHVKASSVAVETRVAKRIPWQGGTISSNKDEALRKFYQRKLQTGAQLTPQQLQAVQQRESPALSLMRQEELMMETCRGVC